jgi:hypothetical protein
MYFLRWDEPALAELAAAWMVANSELRQMITAATHRVDQRLRLDAIAEGESRPDGKRILFEAPLGIAYRIEADGRTVSVLHVWVFHKRSKK